MPNWKYPCIECKKPVKTNQKGLQCNICTKWVHFRCTDLSEDQYLFLETNENLPFYCLICKLRALYADGIFNDANLSVNLDQNLNDSTCSNDSFSVNSSDFVYLDESSSDSDPESRGLNFDSLPVRHTNTKNKKFSLNLASLRTINYKYPCLVCLGPCKKKHPRLHMLYLVR